jgi:hypothetical protein
MKVFLGIYAEYKSIRNTGLSKYFPGPQSKSERQSRDTILAARTSASRAVLSKNTEVGIWRRVK